MRTLLTVADRTAVLFLGLAAGAAIGLAFGNGGSPLPRVQAPVLDPETTPPPPAATVGPAAPAAGEAAAVAPVAAAECALPYQPALLRTLAGGGKVRIGVFGDSYGDGIWSALYHVLPAKRGYEVAKFSQQSTGFTRYGSLNLEQHVRQQLGAAPVDIAVVSFGANDAQGVLSGRHAAPLLSAEWQEIVGRRVDGFVRELRAHGAVVYWIGLPRMRQPEFDAEIVGMNAFYERRMKALGVPWIATAPLTAGADGGFTPYLPDGPDGEPKLMRANDGIHMTYAGYVRITRGLVGRIDAYVAAARTMAATQAPPAPLPAPEPAAAS